jgi:S-adenosylmethionine-dependent methyltransferase
MSRIVQDFYNKNVVREWERLDTPLSRIEFATALRLIDKYFPSTGHVCDIGSGPGRYAIALLQHGYQVTLVDLSEALLQFAHTQIARLGLHAERCMHGDARDLSALASEVFDAALLMGPMYHVIEANDRRKVLGELRRVLKAGSPALITYLNAWGLIRTGLVDFPNRYCDVAFVRSMLAEHVFQGQELANFTECYWSTPPAALAEVQQAEFEVVSYASAQGFAGGMRPLLEPLATARPDVYANIVQVAAETSELPQYRDTGEHLHIVVRKRSRACTTAPANPAVSHYQGNGSDKNQAAIAP